MVEVRNLTFAFGRSIKLGRRKFFNKRLRDWLSTVSQKLTRISSGVLFIVIVVQKAHLKRRLASDGPPENTATLCVPPNLDRFEDDIWTVNDALSFPRASRPHYNWNEAAGPENTIRSGTRAVVWRHQGDEWTWYLLQVVVCACVYPSPFHRVLHTTKRRPYAYMSHWYRSSSLVLVVYRVPISILENT